MSQATLEKPTGGSPLTVTEPLTKTAKTATIYFGWTGQTIAEENGIITSKSVGLSDHGKQEASVTAKEFENIPFDFAICANNIAAWETTEIILRGNKALRSKTPPVPGCNGFLTSRNMGDLEGKLMSDLSQISPEVLEVIPMKSGDPFFYQAPNLGLEPVGMMSNRIEKFMDIIRSHENKYFLVVADIQFAPIFLAIGYGTDIRSEIKEFDPNDGSPKIIIDWEE